MNQESMIQTNLFGTENEYLDYKTASQKLGVSVATLRNWVKAKHVSSTDSPQRKQFKLAEIQELKEKLTNGNIDRLKSRANKKNSTLTFIPKEHILEKQDYEKIVHIVNSISETDISIEFGLLLLSLNILEKNGLVINKLDQIKTIEDIKFKNANVEKVIIEWWKSLDNSSLDDYDQFLTISIPEITDILGIIYQSLLAEGKKAAGGSYYTPEKVVNLIVEQYAETIAEEATILDPCCGTGQFLLAFSKYSPNPSNLWGYDIDETAVNIARVNLLTIFPENDFFPNIYPQNTLLARLELKFDIVATNPPWGYHFSPEDHIELTRLYPSVTSKEAFSYFIAKALNTLKDGGRLTFVLPESILKVKQHGDIRKKILQTSSINEIVHLGNVFTKVMSDVILLSLERTNKENNLIKITTKDQRKHIIGQSRFQANDQFVFDTEISDKDSDVINKVYNRNHVTLKDNAEWALGIVTGNNNAFLSNEKTSFNERVIKGTDVKQFYLEEPTNFLVFDPVSFQQTAPEEKYRAAEKLIYRFISKRLVFAYDNKQVLTLNSANILIPKLSDYPIKVILAFLNSTLFQYLHKKKFNTIKILRGDLEQLPLPELSENEKAAIIRKVEMLIKTELDQSKREKTLSELNDLIFSIFRINEEEKEHIKSSIER